MPARTATLGALVRRALARLCPVCGIGKPFEGWFRMAPECPHCGHHYEREDGYWLNAMIVDTAVTESVFAVLFVAVLIATLPDVQWMPVLMVAAVTNVLVPIFFYPLAKTTWVAIDTYFNPSSAERSPRAPGA